MIPTGTTTSGAERKKEQVTMIDPERPDELVPLVEEARKQEESRTGLSIVGDIVDGTFQVAGVVIDSAASAGSAVIEGAGDVGGAILDAAPDAAEAVVEVVGAIVSGILDS
jgi:hypothetical protein